MKYCIEFETKTTKNQFLVEDRPLQITLPRTVDTWKYIIRHGPLEINSKKQ